MSERKKIAAGAAQVSILGPELRNASYDGLVRLQLQEESGLVGYVDNVAVFVAGRNLKLAQLKLN